MKVLSLYLYNKKTNMFTDKNEKPIVVTLLILVLGLIIVLMIAMMDRPLFQEPTTPPPYGDGVACTMDAKICPDGSGVGRIPPSCEFAPCPGEDDHTPSETPPVEPIVDDNVIGGGIGVCTMEAKMCPDGETYVSRTGSTCEFEKCPSEGNSTTSSTGERPIPYGDDMVCAEIYSPVCASIDVQCVTTPCPAMEKTFSNECEANKMGADVLYEGTCE